MTEFKEPKYTMSYDYLKKDGENLFHLKKEGYRICDLLNEQDVLISELEEDNNQYKILVESLKDENQKLKLKLKDLGVEYY